MSKPHIHQYGQVNIFPSLYRQEYKKSENTQNVDVSLSEATILRFFDQIFYVFERKFRFFNTLIYRHISIYLYAESLIFKILLIWLPH